MSKQGALPKPWENPVVFSQRILKALWNQFFNNAHQTENPSLVEADQIIKAAQLNTAQDATLNEAENIIKKAQVKERVVVNPASNYDGYSYSAVGSYAATPSVPYAKPVVMVQEAQKPTKPGLPTPPLKKGEKNLIDKGELSDQERVVLNQEAIVMNQEGITPDGEDAMNLDQEGTISSREAMIEDPETIALSQKESGVTYEGETHSTKQERDNVS
jgi:hypothetical protein